MLIRYTEHEELCIMCIIIIPAFNNSLLGESLSPRERTDVAAIPAHDVFSISIVKKLIVLQISYIDTVLLLEHFASVHVSAG